MTLAFFVPGIPIPKGSMRAFMPKGWKRPIVTADNKKTKPWQREIAIEAIRAANDAPPMEGPVAVGLVFYMPRPKSAAKRLYPTKKPDLDKLVRAVFDALKLAHVYVDDAQVCDLRSSKHYVQRQGEGLEAPGVLIKVSPGGFPA